MKILEKDESVVAIKGIGEKKQKLLNKLKIRTVSDLLEYYPRDYKDRTVITKLADIKLSETYTFLCKIKEKPEVIRVKNLLITRAKICDETGMIDCVWFGMPYLKQSLEVGSSYYFVGKVERRLNKLTLISPEFEKYVSTESLSYSRIVPVYKLTRGLTQKSLRSAINTALSHIDEVIIEDIPQTILKKNKLTDKKTAVRNIHFPESRELFFDSRRRLIFDELFVVQTALYKFKTKYTKETSGFIIDEKLDLFEIVRTFPFELTTAQKSVLLDVEKDMRSGFSMNRLIQGDVGSGKTAVAICASFWAIKSGYQAVIMAPTEVLALQHFETFNALLSKFGIETVLLNGSQAKKQKDEILSAICSGKAKMIIGTHAVIQKMVVFNRLGLVITDEQHRFGVNQRAALQGKGKTPHTIVMTATPIPRTLALILYGDLDISAIDTMPPGRQRIITSAVNSTYRKRIYDFVEKQVKEGRQVYIICPAIEKKDDELLQKLTDQEAQEVESRTEITYLNEYLEDLRKNVFPDIAVAGIHGRIKPQEKQDIMTGFAKNQIKILVSTTVIEVGINVPNATVMIVENAERFGLSQLHQLRGRVGRGAEQSYCILISDSENETAKKRLETMKSTTDGFVISEKDLELRGSGDFFGTKQHGLPALKIANLFKDIDILRQAEQSAREVIDDDPYLEKPENAVLSMTIEKMFCDVKFGINL